MDFIKQPWPWYVAGPLIGLIVPALLLMGNKTFGISSTLRQVCAAYIPANIAFFKYDWKKESWNLFFALGIIAGGFIATYFLSVPGAVNINPDTVALLKQEGVKDFNGLLPQDVFSFSQLFTLKGFVFIIVGGFLVGFGTRYAGGCTSGHAIMGISNLQWPSLVATCCFMVGGFIMTWFILPYLVQL
ncbi:YeeE/YedE family protein [Mucilaginibacter glaciei]|uniref:YeeE/YedE family protein n=1 Tax=Mucilaginibacter glaciei TaxID=2772109 RepID=A0A926S4N0_9SPHI|nr:YeeE/YedE thiosulfate transporter family protein [Mucilaginibacter glaciei]MBD1391931.1 YeeE/YedE family protein [Mucilaginibacter glaciei]